MYAILDSHWYFDAPLTGERFEQLLTRLVTDPTPVPPARHVARGVLTVWTCAPPGEQQYWARALQRLIETVQAEPPGCRNAKGQRPHWVHARLRATRGFAQWVLYQIEIAAARAASGLSPEGLRKQRLNCALRAKRIRVAELQLADIDRKLQSPCRDAADLGHERARVRARLDRMRAVQTAPILSQAERRRIRRRIEISCTSAASEAK